MPEIPPCPECWAGKHDNCDGSSWDADTDGLAPCPCQDPSHAPGPAVWVCDGCMRTVTRQEIAEWADGEHVLCGECYRHA